MKVTEGVGDCRNVFPENIVQAAVSSYRTKLSYDPNDTKAVYVLDDKAAYAFNVEAVRYEHHCQKFRRVMTEDEKKRVVLCLRSVVIGRNCSIIEQIVQNAKKRR
ncbi:hypothetical protein EVAR_82913_1 [Eumeta japonica]|uniref:Uncharacterized protein n=1 Tax=Eumeta variegata TaxID=151549 RepID=A0A4C1X2K4_EUMVA|nr:hypothetical protein EVAR_82913_1 [Eumeta japonica]